MKMWSMGIAVRPIIQKTNQQGIILIPESVSVKSKYKEGVVEAVGSGTKDYPMEVEIGDRILYKKDNYPISNDCEIIRMDDVLYVESDELI